MTDQQQTAGPSQPNLNATPFEEALVAAGNGPYTYMLAATCSLILMSVGMDMFGFALVINAACDLNLNMTQKTMLLSCPYIAVFLTSYVWGYIADTRGRRYALLRALGAGFALCIISSFSTHWIMLGILKLLAVGFYSAGNSAAYTIFGECCMAQVRRKYTLRMTCLIIGSGAVGSLLTYPTLYYQFSFPIPGLGINFKPWRLLLIVLAIPLGTGGLLLYFFSESPKFLANWDRNTDAIVVLQRIHAINTRGKNGPYPIKSIVLEDHGAHLKMPFCRRIYEQGAPLFRKPLLYHTLRLYYLTCIAYMTNNGLLSWLPDTMRSITSSMGCKTCPWSDICKMIYFTHGNKGKTAVVCTGRVDNLALIAISSFQTFYGVMTLVTAMFPNQRRIIFMTVLAIAGSGAMLVQISPEPISGTVFYGVLMSTCLGMGLLSSYFIDLYPTSYRGMVQCLGVMVGRSGTFIGIHFVGQTIFHYCRFTFGFYAVFVYSGVVVAYFLPRDIKVGNLSVATKKPPDTTISPAKSSKS